MRIVFLSEGKLFLKEDGRDAVEIESPFARAAVDRAATRNERNAWKTKDREGGDPFSNRLVWGRQAERAADGAPTFRHVARGAKPGELLYALAMSASSGLFRYNLDSHDETRLFHRQDFDACGLTCNPATGEIVVASRDKDDLGKLEQMDESSRRRDRVTAGDGHDSQPSYHPAQPNVVFFQSSGAGRDEEGRLVALGPAAICRLECASGKLETVREDEHYDFLAPKMDAAGRLYFIRRPFAARHDVPLGDRLKAFVLVPWHLASAVFGFLDAFSRLFGKQSLKPAAGGPNLPAARQRYATFQDMPVQLERVLNKRTRNIDGVQLVPDTWELVRREADGREEVIGRHVVAFDLGPDGALVYTDGLRIWQTGDSPHKLHEGHIVQAVLVV